MARTNHTLTKGEKALLWWVAAFVAVVIGGGWWWLDRNETPTVSIPAPVMPAPNALDYYTDATALLADKPIIEAAIYIFNGKTPPGSAPTMARIEAAVKANEPAIAKLREGFQYPFQAEPIRSFHARQPQYALYRQMGRTLRVDAELRRRRGDYAGAMRSGLDCMEMAICNQHGGTMIADLVSSSVGYIGRAPLWEISQTLTVKDTRTSLRRLERIIAKRVTFAEVLEEEKRFYIAGLIEAFRNPKWRQTLYEEWGDSETLPRWRFWVVSKRDLVDDVTRFMDRCIANARRPYAAKPPPPPAPANPISQVFCYLPERAAFTHVHADVQDHLLLVTLALRAYRLEHGRHPASLSALVPDYLSAVPRDAFAMAGPPRYSLTTTGYLLYSVGPDGRDDGGVPSMDGQEPPKTGRRLYAGSSGDLVAGVNVQ
ncbi:MAG TPA: hypothetical protein PLZ36_11945 [Armatimonadota bacterium]|nr:hypothetical protein [Armatimonadota bacterium]